MTKLYAVKWHRYVEDWDFVTADSAEDAEAQVRKMHDGYGQGHIDVDRVEIEDEEG